MRTVENINNDWLFKLKEDTDAMNVIYDDSDWQEVMVPHDWAINSRVDPPDDFCEADLINPSNYRWKAWQGFFDRYGIAWYRRKMEFPDAKRHFIEFDGVFQESDVYLNGHHLGHHHYGYTSFGYEVSRYTEKGENILAVRVDNSKENLCDRWYSGCGIIRSVKLISTDNIRIKRHGIAVRDEEITNSLVKFGVSVELDGRIQDDLSIQVLISNKENGQVFEKVQKASLINMFSFEIKSPLLWSPDSPCLYKIEVLLVEGGETADNESFRYGFRKVKISALEGFKLNDKKIKLKGVNLHHDLGAIGAAWNTGIMRMRLKTLQEIGCNAIRTSHNPPAQELIELCDEMGFLVMEESFDKWDTLRYGLIFDKCWEEDLTEMIMRDRNHPCIFCWSVGNEVNNQSKDDMIAIVSMLSSKAKALDSSRYVTYCMEPHVFVEEQKEMTPGQKAELANRIAEHVDILSGNYHEQYYSEYHKLMPDMTYIASEAYPFFQNSVYQMPAYIDKNPWIDVMENDFVLGEFIWPGADYLGEANWPSRMWSGGIVDSTSRIKQVGYLIKSMWNDKPMVHVSIYDESVTDMHANSIWGAPPLAGHWNFKHKSRPFVRAYIFTNCDRVSIMINSKPVKDIKVIDLYKGCIDTYLPNIPGELKVIGYMDCKAVCSHVLKTSKEPNRIELNIKNGDDETADMIMIEACVVDIDGVTCPHYDKCITFISSGVQFIAGDSGNPTDHTPYSSNTRKTLFGRCTGIFEVKQGISGTITAFSDNLSATISIKQEVHI